MGSQYLAYSQEIQFFILKFLISCFLSVLVSRSYGLLLPMSVSCFLVSILASKLLHLQCLIRLTFYTQYKHKGKEKEVFELNYFTLCLF
jgi:hypothetical protein